MRPNSDTESKLAQAFLYIKNIGPDTKLSGVSDYFQVYVRSVAEETVVHVNSLVYTGVYITCSFTVYIWPVPCDRQNGSSTSIKFFCDFLVQD